MSAVSPPDRTICRPDGRLFVRLAERTAAELDSVLSSQPFRDDLHLNVAGGETELAAHALAGGFVESMTSECFDVPFDAALASPQAVRSTRIRIIDAAAVHPDRLFELDNDLRRDVPGTDGWLGNRDWFDDELASPAHVAAAYVVGVDRQTKELVGLCRFWRNADGPRLGLVAVKRPYRTGFVAAALLHHAATEASQWGSPTFKTETARPALQRRLRKLGATSTGSIITLRLPKRGTARQS